MGTAFRTFGQESIAALLDVLVHDSGRRRNVGRYHTGPQLEQMLGLAGIGFRLGAKQGRLAGVRAAVMQANSSPATRRSVASLFERAVAPADYTGDPDRLGRTIAYLNRALAQDGFELVVVGDRASLLLKSTNTPATQELEAAVRGLDFGSVSADLERALTQAGADPAGAITSSCSVVESVCKCILDEIEEAYPSKETISNLVNTLVRKLDEAPDAPGIDPDTRQIRQGLLSIANGIGALRTHMGDAHGHGASAPSPSPRLARLACHAASTLSLFLIDTWQERYNSGEGDTASR